MAKWGPDLDGLGWGAEDLEQDIVFDRVRMRKFYGVCMAPSRDGDKWPNYFCQPVQVGDMIMSANKRMLKVIEVSHVYMDRDSVMVIKLGKDTGGSTAMEGGVRSEGFM